MARILLIEDNDDNRNMLVRRLERQGFEMLEAPDAEIGVDVTRSEKPDLVLMDIGLPGMNGYEATRLLKSDENVSHIPVVALTAHAMSSDRDMAFEAGCDDYDTKPIDLPRLLSIINKHLAT